MMHRPRTARWALRAAHLGARAAPRSALAADVLARNGDVEAEFLLRPGCAGEAAEIRAELCLSLDDQVGALRLAGRGCGRRGAKRPVGLAWHARYVDGRSHL
jgi:hypothetical protein